jgi:hypothetical protein
MMVVLVLLVIPHFFIQLGETGVSGMARTGFMGYLFLIIKKKQVRAVLTLIFTGRVLVGQQEIVPDLALTLQLPVVVVAEVAL